MPRELCEHIHNRLRSLPYNNVPRSPLRPSPTGKRHYTQIVLCCLGVTNPEADWPPLSILLPVPLSQVGHHIDDNMNPTYRGSNG